MHIPAWDIFCSVIDNFGDAGVCWRLARQLVHEHGYRVRLLIDAPQVLAQMVPGMHPARDGQECGGVRIERWHAGAAPRLEAEVVIEAFGAPVPEAYLGAMVRRSPAPVWINLEYLSAEDWVEGCHRLPSPHPRLPLTQWFFYPGFTAATGGLLREASLFARRDAFQSDPAEALRLIAGLGVAAPAADALRLSLFGYESAAVAGLLEALSASDQAIWCGVPQGRISAAVARWLGGGFEQRTQRGSLCLAPLPFVSQDDYDRLLWSCDLNFVRGEDSFVRAQWAARPLVWQIYPQAEDAHLAKLDAFARHYRSGLDAGVAKRLEDFQLAWNTGDAERTRRGWQSLAACLPDLRAHAAGRADALASQADLATQLALFVKSKLK